MQLKDVLLEFLILQHSKFRTVKGTHLSSDEVKGALYVSEDCLHILIAGLEHHHPFRGIDEAAMPALQQVKQAGCHRDFPPRSTTWSSLIVKVSLQWMIPRVLRIGEGY